MSTNTKNNLNGFLVIDKPYDMGSTQVVSKLKWALSPQKIGHAGTLDPLATGVLPIALGHATKLIPFVMDGTKVYDFTVTWGKQTDTDDAAGQVLQATDRRPSKAEIQAILPQFIGQIEQLPPAYSALKIAGRRAYDLARSGQEVTLKPRPVQIDSLILLDTTPDSASFRVTCGKGTYVRSLGRDMGQKLGCFGYITSLRRISCGPFRIEDALPFSLFSDKNPAVSLLPMTSALKHLPALALPPELATRLRQGQRLPLRDIRPFLNMEVSDETTLRLITNDQFIGLIRYADGTLHPYRIFPD